MTDTQHTSDSLSSDPCEKCEAPVYGYVEQRCCDGRECCCMGMPLSPCWCTKCWEQWQAESEARAARVQPQVAIVSWPLIAILSGEDDMDNDSLTKEESNVLDRAWKDFFAAWCALKALVEAGGATIKMDIKVKAAKQEKRS